jgi:protein tyrosine phosphatase
MSLLIDASTKPPKTTLYEDLVSIRDHFLDDDETTALDTLKRLPQDIRWSLHRLFHEAHNFPNEKNYGMKLEVAGSSPVVLKAKVITHFMKNFLVGESLKAADQEFAELELFSKSIDRELHAKTGMNPKNAHKNQWDIAPYDSTLVKLKSGNYINANLVFEKYILTQCPVDPGSHTSSPTETRDVFWEMVEQKNVKVIVMLNGEQGAEYSPYFPHSNKKPATFSQHEISLMKSESFIVDSLNEDDPISVTVRTLRLRKDHTTRIIHHIKSNDWPDFTPGKQNIILKIMELLDKFQGADPSPIVIHCRAGVGRAGQFVTTYHLVNKVKKGLPYDVKATVLALRSPVFGRHPTIMQGKEQYRAVHAIINVIKNPI